MTDDQVRERIVKFLEDAAFCGLKPAGNRIYCNPKNVAQFQRCAPPGIIFDVVRETPLDQMHYHGEWLP